MNVSNTFSNKPESLGDLTTYQVGVIESSAHRALRQLKDALLKSYNLTGVEWYIIGTVADAGPNGIRTTDLSRIIGTTMGFLTKSITLIEAKGFVYKQANAEDGRSTFICFSEDHRSTLNEIESALRTMLRESVYGLVTPEELLTYVKVMHKFSKIDV